MNTKGIIGHNRQLKKLQMMLNRNMIPQAMIYTGIEGIGKRLIAGRFLGSIFCGEENPPCLVCRDCRQIEAGVHPDLIFLEPNEKGVIPIGDPGARESGSVRWMMERFSRKSLSGRFGIIINGIDRISKEGETALLKTIEEPQEGAHIIMLASNKSEIIPTILSRSFEINFSPLKDRDVFEILENLGVNDYDRNLVSRFSGGSAGMALSIVNKSVFNDIMEVCGELSRYINTGGGLVLDLTSLLKKIDGAFFLAILINIYRNMLISGIRGSDFGLPLHEIKIHDEIMIKKSIKIFLALKSRLTYNINIRSAMKGMFYSIDRGDADVFNAL